MKKLPTYKSISHSEGPAILKEKKSKFLGWAYPVSSEEEITERVQLLRNKYTDASHVCYAYRIGPENPRIRFNDDGEPSNSAGRPILGQIESAGLDNVLVCVVRFYGGTKLGVGGLIQAYRGTARAALEESRVATYIPVTVFRLEFEYDTLDLIMRLLSQLDLKILRQEFELTCSLEVEVPPGRLKKARDGITAIGGVRLEEKQSYRADSP